MGVASSLLRRLRVPSIESLFQDHVYTNYFEKEKIKKFEDFHLVFVDLCNEINTIFPGKHYKVPPCSELKNFFEQHWKDNQKPSKEAMIDYIKRNVKEHKPNETSMILTGLVAPGAAAYLKKTGENTPQLKKFRLHLIPDFVFVPMTTFLALSGVRALQIKSTTRS